VRVRYTQLRRGVLCETTAMQTAETARRACACACVCVRTDQVLQLADREWLLSVRFAECSDAVEQRQARDSGPRVRAVRLQVATHGAAVQQPGLLRGEPGGHGGWEAACRTVHLARHVVRREGGTKTGV
jgi:hypothetical protein